MYVQTMHTVKEIEVKKREIERRNKMMEATEANKNEAIKQVSNPKKHQENLYLKMSSVYVVC